MEIKAAAKFVRMSPRKIKLVIDLIRGVDVGEALTRLQFTTKAAVVPVTKLLKSAVANAEENFKLDKSNLFVKEIKADGGPVLKRWTPRAFGRATPILKRSAHLHIVLAEKVPTQATDKVKTDKAVKEEKDDLIKVSSLSEVKKVGDKKDAAISQKKVGGAGAVSGTKKPFANKIFNRKSGEK